MICKICGCEMKNNGDWFACPTCGSVHFGPDPDEKKSEETPIIKKAEPISEIEEEPVKKEDALFDSEKEFVKKEAPTDKAEEMSAMDTEPPVKAKEMPVIDTEPTIEISEPTTEAENAADDITPEPSAKQNETEYGINLTELFDESPVKSDTFTLDEDAFRDSFASFLNEIEDTSKEEPKQEENGEEDPSEEKKKLTIKDVVDFMIPIVAAVVIAFVLKTFIIANAKVPTGSMVSTINVGDRIIASRLAYKTYDPDRYNIVLFYFPDDESEIFVKRILGLPGETLEVIDGVVYVTTHSGKTIQTEQSFVNPAEAPSGNAGPYYIPEKGETVTIEGDYCFAENGELLGHSNFVDKYCVQDDRGNYVIAENLYFMMGDNRNWSNDSREWGFPYVAESKIIGKVLYRYYPFDSMGKIE